MSESSPIIVWIRRDLRLTDHAALHEAGRSGRPVIPVFIRDHHGHAHLVQHGKGGCDLGG